MFQRRPRRFRHRSDGRGHQRHANGGGQIRITPNAFSNNERRNNFRSTQSAEKLLEKYNALAKEALSSGDRILSENYFQHAEHFSRIVDGKNKNQTGIITGDASDELFAGYNFFLSKNYKEIDSDLKKIWKVMEFPSKKIGAHFGMNVEYPYLNEKVKKLAMEIPVELKINSERNKTYGKWILRKAFEDKISRSLLWRDKTPMGDGSGSAGLVTFFDQYYSDETYNQKLKDVKKEDDVMLYSKEQLYYYQIFRGFYFRNYIESKNI